MNHHPSKLKIAMLSIHSSPVGELGTRDTGGMSVYIRELAKILGGRGHRIDVFTGRSTGKKEPVFDIYDNVRIIRLDGGVNGNIQKYSLHEYLPKFYLELESFRSREKIKYDVIHSHYWLSGILGAEAWSAWNAAHMLTYHTIGAVKNHVCPEENEPDLRLTNERMLATQCDQIIVPTLKDKNFLIQSYDAPKNKIRIVPCGVNLKRFKPVDKTIARQELGINVEDRIVLYVGRYVPVKGLDRLLKSFSHLTGYPRPRLIMVGGDGKASPMFQRLHSEAEALGIQDFLTFSGRVEQEKLPLYYSAADVLAIPSKYESFGLVALEALACGTPVVATPVGAMKNIVENGITGYVARNFDTAHFARLLDVVLKNQQANGFSREQIRTSVNEFSWKNSAFKMLEAYRAAVS